MLKPILIGSFDCAAAGAPESTSSAAAATAPAPAIVHCLLDSVINVPPIGSFLRSYAQPPRQCQRAFGESGGGSRNGDRGCPSRSVATKQSRKRHRSLGYFASLAMTLLARGVGAFDNHVFDLAGAVAAERGRSLVFGRVEAADGLLEGGKLDHDEAVELLRPFHDLIASATGQDLAAVGR